MAWTFASLDGLDAEFDRAAIAVLPVPYDSTTSYRGGARDGPQAIIGASRFLELYDPELDLEPSQWGIATLPDLEPSAVGPAETLDRVEQAVGALARAGKVVALLGGEHSLAVGAVRAFRTLYPDLCVVQLDAHADLRDVYMGSPFSHASTMRRIREICPVAAQAGVRSLSLEERDYLRGAGVRVPLYEAGAYLDPETIAAMLGGLMPHVYVTVDLDVLDPSIMAAVGTPEPGGISWEEALRLLRAVAERSRIVGFDLAELAPAEGPAAAAYTAAKLAYKIMGYSLALGPGARAPRGFPERG